MNKIFRFQSVIINRDFRSCWTRLGQTGARWLLWPAGIEFPISWAGESLFSNQAWNDRQTSQSASSYKRYKEAIRRYIKRTDDLPFPGDDPRRLRIGVYFPKTRHTISIRLAELKMTRSEEDRAELSTAENREALLYQFYDYRNSLTKARQCAITLNARVGNKSRRQHHGKRTSSRSSSEINQNEKVSGRLQDSKAQL